MSGVHELHFYYFRICLINVLETLKNMKYPLQYISILEMVIIANGRAIFSAGSKARNNVSVVTIVNQHYGTRGAK